jgi:hypothetical protein
MGVPCLGLGLGWLIGRVIPSEISIYGPSHQFRDRNLILLAPGSQTLQLLFIQIDIGTNEWHFLPPLQYILF